MQHSTLPLILLSLLAGSVRQTTAEVRLAGIFADHMILQREHPVQIWGWANKDRIVRVRFADQAVETSAGADGVWNVTLKPLPATREGKTLRVDASARPGASQPEITPLRQKFEAGTDRELRSLQD